MRPTGILHPEQRTQSKAYLVNKLREAVYNWREEGYPGTTKTTRRLLQYWFYEDHIVNNEPFEFWFCQREAIETLIYIYEVMKKQNFIDMAKDFGSGRINYYDPSYDQYPLYAFKMATGSGKTFVMALAIVWSYFNHRFEDSNYYTSKFLLIAGEKNVIYDRLKRDFNEGKIFKDWSFIPPEWRDEFNIKVILKEDPINIIPEGVLFLTNIQQLQDRKTIKKEVSEYVDDLLKLKDVNKQDIYQENRIREVLTTCPNIMILKDEAHHIYSFEKAWKNILIGLNEKLEKEYGKGINMELDFTATPKTESGALFPWIIVDFHLKEAIEMNIVKRPLKGKVTEAEEIESDKVVERYRAWIDAGIRRWREHRKLLKDLEKKPILFIQCTKNTESDEVFEYINSIPDLKGKVLLIHTDSTGEVKKSDLPKARDFAKTIDEPDPEKNPYEAIVSTMMLNEGWDVRNVDIIVGLRPYGSKRRVLPEQVIGRGLRKMFPDEDASDNPEKSVINILEVIGPPGLTQILEDLEDEEDIKFGEFEIEEPINLTTIFVEEKKMDRDIEIPILRPRISIREFSIDDIGIDELSPLNIDLEDKMLSTDYVAIDMLKGIEVIKKRRWDLPVPKNPESVIAYYADQIRKELRIPGNFPCFNRIVKEYVKERLFIEKVNLKDPRVLYNLSRIEVKKKLIDLFVNKFKDRTFTEREPEIIDKIKISDTRPFPWTKLVYPANKCIFNYTPCDNNFEVDFAKFLDKCSDVSSFCKIVHNIGFFVEYRDSKGNLRIYYPDFVVLTINNEYIIFETKGREDIDVSHKDNRIRLWCKDVKKLTKSNWSFKRIGQEDFEKYRFNNIKELLKTLY